MLKLTMLPFNEHQLLHSEHTESLEREDIVDRLYVMRQQEQSSYICTDYLADDRSNYQDAVKQNCGENNTSSTNNNESKTSSPNVGVDAFCREQIVEWSFRVADYFHINRECVAISVSHLDRFLSTCSCDRRTFKLAATTCLYLAVKMNELPNTKPDMLSVLSDLSRGEFHVDHIIEMESLLLESLAWLVHPPTPSCHVGHMLCLLESKSNNNDNNHGSMNVIRSISALASFFTELSLSDYYFTTECSSTIAMAAILNAMEILNYDELSQDNSIVDDFFEEVSMIIETSPSSPRVIVARKRLWKVYERSEEFTLHEKPHDVARGSKSRSNYKSSRNPTHNLNNVSPICVSRKS